MAVIAPSLGKLREEIDERWPNRSKASDGWIADYAHSLRVSEHNPDSGGIVRAMDITTDGSPRTPTADELLALVRYDKRLHYIVSRRKIYNSHSYGVKKYGGPNPHITHMHFSLRNNTSENASAAVRKAAAEDTSPWFTTAPSPDPSPVKPKGVLGMTRTKWVKAGA